MLTRRQFFRAGMGAGISSLLAACLGKKVSTSGVSSGNEYSGKTELILLGTTGGPRILKERASPSSLIVVNNQLYVVDCGEGAPRQLALAGFSGRNFEKLKCVFITHNHPDHVIDCGNLLHLSILLLRFSGRSKKIDTYGPPPIGEMTKLYFEIDEKRAVSTGAKKRPRWLETYIDVHEVVRAGPVMEDANVKVSCTRVIHPPVLDVYAYRFDTQDRSITFSGDTSFSHELIKLAKGSDILVHEAYYKPWLDSLPARLSRLKRHFHTAHTSAEDAGKVAQEAGVKTLVMNHLAPGNDPDISDEIWKERAKKFFKGRVIVGRDLLRI